MKLTAKSLPSATAPVVWNVGIDIPNGIRDVKQYLQRVQTAQRHPDELSFHIHSDKTLAQVVEVLTLLLNHDRQDHYRLLPLQMVFDISNVYVAAGDIFNLLNLHFQAKRRELGVIEDAFFDA